MHCAGKQDDLIKFDAQEKLIAQLVKLNGCPPQGRKVGPYATRYANPDAKTPVISFIHDGGHELPNEEPDAIVRFFKARASRPASPAPG